MNIELSVVAPCFNEVSNVSALATRVLNVFRERQLRGELILVDDGSSDGTGQKIDELASTHDAVRAVHHERNSGIEAAWRSGVATSHGRHLCFIDADLQNLPEDIWRLYNELRFQRCDMVQGYRSSIGRLRDSRWLLSKGLNLILNVLFGMRMRDNKAGFVLATRDCIEDVLDHRYAYRHFQTFITVAAFAKGYTIAEVETLFASRYTGKSFIGRWPMALVMAVLVDVVKAFFEYRVFRVRRSVLGEFLATHPVRQDPHRYRGLRRTLYELFFLTMPLHKWMISRDARWMLERLKESQWLSQAEMRELQERRLRRLIRHAYQTVPYYTRVMDDAGLSPDAIRTLADLRRLPMISKDDVRKNLYFDLFSRKHDKQEMLRISTSGSTAEPLVLYAERRQLEMRWASTWRAMEWTGWRLGDPQARLWHQTIGLGWSQIVREHIDAFLMRRIFIPAYDLTQDTLPRFIKRLKRHRPVLIDGYAECFNLLARYGPEHGIGELRPRAVVSSAQVLPDQVRAQIRARLQTEVYDKYGSREFSGIAYECEYHDGHHVMAESYIVELIKDGQPARPGEMGEVVITDLNNHCIPLIRYRVGDLAIAIDDNGVCACGRGLPRIGRIEGRVQSVVFCGGGKWLPGTFFAHFFKEFDHLVRQYQVVQSEKGAFDLVIVKGPQFDSTAFETEVLAGLRRVVGGDTTIDVQFVDHIPLGRTGKHRAVVSALDFEFQDLA